MTEREEVIAGVASRIPPSRHSNRMAAIRSRDTKPELALRRELWKAGLRFRTHSRLPGRPDVVFAGPRVAVFVDGDFWHGYDWRRLRPKLKSPLWVEKIRSNRARDRMYERRLLRLGWAVVRFWEHEINADVASCAGVVRELVARRT